MDKKEFLKIKLQEYTTISNELLLNLYIKKITQCRRLKTTLNNMRSYKVDQRANWEYLTELKETIKFIKKEILKRM